MPASSRVSVHRADWRQFCLSPVPCFPWFSPRSQPGCASLQDESDELLVPVLKAHDERQGQVGIHTLPVCF